MNWDWIAKSEQGVCDFANRAEHWREILPAWVNGLWISLGASVATRRAKRLRID